MDYETTVLKFADIAISKRNHVSTDLLSFLVLAIMAGAYVGLGILLIFSVGQGVDPGIRPLVMGASFGIALLLVIFAGSELYTGHTMYMTIGLLTHATNFVDLLKCWLLSWSGNLIGAFCLAIFFVFGGGGLILNSADESLIFQVASTKMNAHAVSLFLKAILCNWLVCLAIWTSIRIQNEMAKVAVIWFCLYAFIATGFEHSVANMTIFSVALLAAEHPESISMTGAAYNLTFVTLGNAVAGVGIMGVGYWLAAGRPEYVK